MTEPLLQQYRTLSFNKRLTFLQSHVRDDNRTDLPEDFVLDALTEEKEPALQWFLVKGIGILKLARGTPAILRICRCPEREMQHTSLHAVCAWSLGRIGLSAYDSVVELLNDPDEETRRCSVDALGEIGDKRAIPALCAALQRDEQRVKLWAGLSLAKMGDSALSCLKPLAKEAGSEEYVRLIARDAIEKLNKGLVER